MLHFINKNFRWLAAVVIFLCVTSFVCFCVSVGVAISAEYDGYRDGFYYTYSEEGVHLEHCDLKGDVVIPDEIDGRPVVSIGGNDNWAVISEHYAPFFYNAADISSVVLPDTLVYIDNCAFADCVNLDDLKIPSSVRYIGDKAFFNCSKLTSIMLPRGLTSIGWYAFTGSSLTNITLPNGVESIGAYAFCECTSLKSVIIPDSVTGMGGRVFENCSNLTIYCEALSEPFGWNDSWNSSKCPVVWGYNGA